MLSAGARTLSAQQNQPIDEGVLPTSDQQQYFGIELVKLKSTIHNEMDDNGKDWQQQEINQLVLGFLLKSRD